MTASIVGSQNKNHLHGGFYFGYSQSAWATDRASLLAPACTFGGAKREERCIFC